MLVPRDATNVRHPVEIVDSSNAPATGLGYLSSITFGYRRASDTSWTNVTLVNGGVTHADGGFRSLGGNVYEFCWPDAVVVAGESTLTRYVYDGATKYDAIEARLPVVGSRGFLGSTLRVVDPSSTSVRVPITLVDVDGVAITSKSFSDADLDLEVLSNAGSGFVAKTLVSATAGTYTENGWIYLGGPLYEFGIQDGLIVDGGSVFVRVRYNGGDWQYTEVKSLKTSQLDMTQLTPDGYSIGDQLDKIGTTTGNVVVTGGVTSTNADRQFPSISIAPETTSEEPYYQASQWQIVFRPLESFVNGEDIVFALKSDKADIDSESIIEVEYRVGTGVTTVTYLNGVADGGTTLATMVYEENELDASSEQLTLTLEDSLTSDIDPGTYYRGLKRVGTSKVIVDDTMTVLRSVTRAHAP